MPCSSPQPFRALTRTCLTPTAGCLPAQHTAPPARALATPGPTHTSQASVWVLGCSGPGCLSLTWARSSQRLPPWLGPGRGRHEGDGRRMHKHPGLSVNTHPPCPRVSAAGPPAPCPPHLPVLGTPAETPVLCRVFPPPLGQPLVPADFGSAANHPHHRSHPVITGQRVPGETDSQRNEDTVADARFPKSRGLAGGWSSLLTSRKEGIPT